MEYKKDNNDTDRFSAVFDYEATKLLLRYFEFQNVFPEGKLDRPIFVKLCKKPFTEKRRGIIGSTLQHGLYGLKRPLEI